MSKDTIESRVALALEKHDKGYNCAQAVSCAFSDLTELDEKTIFRMTEGLGLGMGSTDGTCGAISAAAVLSGIKLSTCNLDAPDSKKVSYACSKTCLDTFKEQNGSLVCRDLKGLDTGTPLRPCNGCIADAVRIIAEHIFNDSASL